MRLALNPLADEETVMRKLVPVMLILMTSAFANGTAMASDKKDNEKSGALSPLSGGDSGKKSFNDSQGNKRSLPFNEEKESSKSQDEKSTSTAGEKKPDSRDNSQKLSSSNEMKDSPESNDKKFHGAESGDHSVAAWDESEQRPEGGKTQESGSKPGESKAPGFDGGKFADHEIDFEVKDLGGHDFTEHEPEVKDYKPEDKRHDELPKGEVPSGHEGEFGWEMAYHILGDQDGDSNNPEYGNGPGKLGKHESLHCGDEFVNIRPTPTPVPAAVWMLGSGVAALVARRRRRA